MAKIKVACFFLGHGVYYDLCGLPWRRVVQPAVCGAIARTGQQQLQWGWSWQRCRRTGWRLRFSRRTAVCKWTQYGESRVWISHRVALSGTWESSRRNRPHCARSLAWRTTWMDGRSRGTQSIHMEAIYNISVLVDHVKPCPHWHWRLQSPNSATIVASEDRALG